MNLTVMTFNTANHFIAPSALVHLLREVNADIVGLQEVSPENAEALKDFNDYPYRVLHGKKFDGKGLLSRFPIKNYDLFTLKLQRPYLHAALEIENQPVDIFVVHLPAPNYRRMEARSPYHELELRMLLERQRDLPTLYMGDFNFLENTYPYRLMTQAGLTDTFRAAGVGRGYTFPTRFQYAYIPLPCMLRLDYIWVSPHFTPVSGHVGRGYGSDHLPVISTLAF